MSCFIKFSLCLFLLLVGASSQALDFSKADSLFHTGVSYKECEAELQKLLPSASGSKEKADVLWRLSRAFFMLGEAQSTKDGKRTYYGKGISYAEQSISANPNNPCCYIWHSANVGRECQTRSLMEQAGKVNVLTGDLSTILDKLGRTDFSEAWQAFAEIYYNHPFKSNDSAINFARKAAMCIPKDELRLSTYTFLATLLYERGWDAATRTQAADRNAAKFSKSYKSVVDKFEFFDGSLGPAFKPVWSKETLGSVSDRQEAKAILNYASGLYNRRGSKNAQDKKDYKNLKTYIEKWK